MKYVYLVKLRKADIYKIGVAVNVESRICSMETDCPFEIEVVYAKQSPDARGVERALHNLYINKRIRREWYRLTQSDVDTIKHILDDGVCMWGERWPQEYKSYSNYRIFKRRVAKLV